MSKQISSRGGGGEYGIAVRLFSFGMTHTDDDTSGGGLFLEVLLRRIWIRGGGGKYTKRKHLQY